MISHERGTILEENPMTFSKISGIYIAQSLILCLVDDCLSFRLYFCWPLYCLSFFNLRHMITPFGILKTHLLSTNRQPTGGRYFESRVNPNTRTKQQPYEHDSE